MNLTTRNKHLCTTRSLAINDKNKNTDDSVSALFSTLSEGAERFTYTHTRARTHARTHKHTKGDREREIDGGDEANKLRRWRQKD